MIRNSLRGEEKIFFTGGRREEPMQDKNLWYWHNGPNEPTKEGPLSYVPIEDPMCLNFCLQQNISEQNRNSNTFVTACAMVHCEIRSIRYTFELIVKAAEFREPDYLCASFVLTTTNESRKIS
jgi:hypothetical protein